MIAIDFDRPRQLHFDLAAIRDLERALDGKPLGIIVNDLANLGVNTLVLALWAGLKHEDRALTPNLVTKRLETYLNEAANHPEGGKKLSLLADALNDALEASGLFRSTEENPPPERPATI